MQPWQAGNGEPLVDLDRPAGPEADGLQAQVLRSRMAAGSDQDLLALDLLPVAEGHGDLRAVPADGRGVHAGPHIDTMASQRLANLASGEGLLLGQQALLGL